MPAAVQDLSPAPARDVARNPDAGWSDYLALGRPGVLSLVLLTAPPALALGNRAWPSAWFVGGVLLGAALVGIGCGALNAWYERDVDAAMERTRDRPLPAGRLQPGQALRFGLAVSALGVAILWGVGGPLAAVIGALTLLHYVLVYTIWLKRRSVHDVIVGAASGAAAPLIADAAVDGAIGIWGVVLFAIVFVWQPPHVWAITLYRKDEYAAAGVPVLPASAGDAATRRSMLVWALALVPLTLLPWGGGVLGPAYAVVASLGGAGFVASIVRAIRLESARADRDVFRASILYLTALFAFMIVELMVV